MAPRKYTLGKRVEAVEETRRRIIDATFELHNEKGILATSMQEIAERADVSLRTVYNHYPTTDDLVVGCGGKVMALLAPPTPEIFDGLTTVEGRVLRMLQEQFAMYERGSVPLETGLREESAVPALAAFFANSRSMHEALVVEAVKPFGVPQVSVKDAVALTDFQVWKSFADQGLSTHHAVEVVCRSLLALIVPDAVGGKETEMARISSSDEGSQR
jgi:AcrR family transcriptional regulator